MYEHFKCFNVDFRLLKTIYVHLLVRYLNKLQNAWCNNKDNQKYLFIFLIADVITVNVAAPVLLPPSPPVSQFIYI